MIIQKTVRFCADNLQKRALIPLKREIYSFLPLEYFEEIWYDYS